ncbi:unnamed protein product [Pleuronectes platessa]|uniref:Uncharacterized protein n=1 Tax=Pleuronectes platessa TaxID=8262 RepID=A0A9N7Z831_PLEPL|nr:unnamed protein product [Pleuronectes platessa]
MLGPVGIEHGAVHCVRWTPGTGSSLRYRDPEERSPSLPSRAFSSTVLATMFSSSMSRLSAVTAAAAHRAPGPPRRLQSQPVLPIDEDSTGASKLH